MSSHGTKGFSLIELMVVLAIVSILISISLPSYRHYTERARFSEVMMAVQPFKIAVAIALQEGEPIEELNNGAHGIPLSPKSSKNLENVSVNRGVITATASATAGGYTYILTPDDNGSSWKASGTCIQAGVCQ